MQYTLMLPTQHIETTDRIFPEKFLTFVNTVIFPFQLTNLDFQTTGHPELTMIMNDDDDTNKVISVLAVVCHHP